MTPIPRKPVRADALRNYERLLASAIEAFAEHGPQASLDDIARAAGVGNATLYRHFPTRQTLLEAVLREHIEELVRRADRLAATRAPVAALRAWLETLVAQGSARHGLAASLLAVIGTPAESECREAIFAAATELVRRAKDSGEIRADLSAPQLLKLVNAIALASEREPDGPRQAGALLNMVFDGIRV